MKVYQVGGSVRDLLLGKTPKDLDLVVVGATEEELLRDGVNFNGLYYFGLQRVGADFPVFIDKIHCVEIAMARTERRVQKTGRPQDMLEFNFDSTVTLEEDLFRRDFTMNAMALDERGRLIDPYGGKADLEEGIIRHLNNAFYDDPLRILRMVKFYSREPYFYKIHPETMELAQGLIKKGVLNSISHERIRNELFKIVDNMSPKVYALMEQLGLFRPEASEYMNVLGLGTPLETERVKWAHLLKGEVPIYVRLAMLMQVVPGKDVIKKFNIDSDLIIAKTHLDKLDQVKSKLINSSQRDVETLHYLMVILGLKSTEQTSQTETGYLVFLHGVDNSSYKIFSEFLELRTELAKIDKGEVLEKAGLLGSKDVTSIVNVLKAEQIRVLTELLK